MAHTCTFRAQSDASSMRCEHCGRTPVNLDGFPAFAPELADTISGFDPDNFRALAAVEPGHFWFRARNRVIAWTFRKFLSPRAKMLEVGCGTGFVLWGLSERFPDLQLFGSEAHPKGLAFARSRIPHAHFLQMDARDIPFENEFDVIGAFDVIEHIRTDEEVLRQFHKALRPDGSVILTVPQHMFLWSAADEVAYHERRYSRRELVEKVVDAGFRVRYVSSFITTLFPLLLVSRVLHRKASHDTLQKNEMGAPSRFGFLLEALCGLDLVLMRMGLSLPFGGSLVLVATKEPA